MYLLNLNPRVSVFTGEFCRLGKEEFQDGDRARVGDLGALAGKLGRVLKERSAARGRAHDPLVTDTRILDREIEFRRAQQVYETNSLEGSESSLEPANSIPQYVRGKGQYRFLLPKRDRSNAVRYYGAAERLRTAVDKVARGSPIKIVTLGSGITAGHGATDGPSWPNYLLNWMQDEYGLWNKTVGVFYNNRLEADFSELSLYYSLPSVSLKGAVFQHLVRGEVGFGVSGPRMKDEDELKAKEFYADFSHPDGLTGARALAEIAIHLVMHAAEDLLHRPLTLEEVQVAAPTLPFKSMMTGHVDDCDQQKARMERDGLRSGGVRNDAEFDVRSFLATSPDRTAFRMAEFGTAWDGRMSVQGIDLGYKVP
eukprot:gene20952-27805_t